MRLDLNITLAIIAFSTAAFILPSWAQPSGNQATAIGGTSDGPRVNNGGKVNADSGTPVWTGPASADASDHSVTGYGGTRLQDLLNDASEPSNVASISPTNVSVVSQKRSDTSTLRPTQH
jgi:hypothetical protein